MRFQIDEAPAYDLMSSTCGVDYLKFLASTLFTDYYYRGKNQHPAKWSSIILASIQVFGFYLIFFFKLTQARELS